MPASVVALAALSLLGFAMSARMLQVSGRFRHEPGGLRLALAALGLLALAIFADTGLIAAREMAKGLGAG